MPGPGRRFEKGQSGNPSGRPKQDQNIVELARAHCPQAIAVLVRLMNDAKVSAATRAVAAEKLLDRGYGRPLSTTATFTGEFRRAADLTDDALAAIITGVQPAPSAPVEPEAEQQPLNLKRVN